MNKPKEPQAWEVRRAKLASEYTMDADKYPGLTLRDAFFDGYNQARADMEAEIAPLLEALEFYADDSYRDGERELWSEDENGEAISMGMEKYKFRTIKSANRAKEALANYKKQMEGK